MFMNITLTGYPNDSAYITIRMELKGFRRKQNETEYDKFISSVRSCFTQLDRQQVEKLINSLLREIPNNNEHANISQFFRQFLDDVYSEDASIDNAGSDSISDSTFFQPPPQIHQQTSPQASDDMPSTSSQDVGNENATNAPVGSDSYEEVASEESEIDAGSFNQDSTEQNAEPPQNTSSQDSVTDENDAEFVEVRVEVETESNPAGNTTDEASSTEQQPQPETGEQEKQPSSGFSVKDVNVKQALQRKGTRKKGVASMAGAVCSKCDVGWVIHSHDKYCGYCGCEVFGFSVRWEKEPLIYEDDGANIHDLTILVENTGAYPITFHPIQTTRDNTILFPQPNDSPFEVKAGQFHAVPIQVKSENLTQSSQTIIVRAQNAPSKLESEKRLPPLKALPHPEFKLTPNPTVVRHRRGTHTGHGKSSF